MTASTDNQTMPAPEPPSATSAPSRWAAVLLLVGVLGLYVATVDLESSSNDTYTAGLGAWVIATSGDPSLEDLPAGSYRANTWTQLNERTGDLVVSRAPGPVAAPVPAELVRRVLTGSETYSLVPQAVTAATLTALAVVFLFLALRTRVALAPSLLAALAFALASPVWSVSANAMWTHPLTLLGVLGMAYFAARERWWLVGVLGGVAVVGRLHTALIVAVLGCGMAWALRRPLIAVQVGLAGLGGVALATVWTYWVYGRWSPTGGYQARATAERITTGLEGTRDGVLVNQLGMWVSPGYGILVWTPVLLLLLPAVVRGWHQVPAWARLLPVGGLLYTLAQAQLNTFTGGDGFFGYRHGLELLATVTPCVAIAATGHLGAVSRRLLGPVLALQLAAFAIGATSEAWFIVFVDAWHDNSLALALRHEPAYGVLVGAFVLVGYLAGRVWQERAAATAQHDAEPAATH